MARKQTQADAEPEAAAPAAQTNGHAPAPIPPDRYELPPPSMFLVADSKEWVVCDEEPNIGLAIYVRTDITQAEQKALRERYQRLVIDHWDPFYSLPVEERDLDDAPIVRQRAMLAPYIYEWNVLGRDPDDAVIPIPPPRTAGPVVFEAISDSAEAWISYVVIGGYRVTGKAGPWRRRLPPSGDTPETPTDPTPSP